MVLPDDTAHDHPPGMRTAAALALVFHVAAGPGTFVEVAVEGVRNDRGHVLAAVCPESLFLTARCPYVASAPAHEGVVHVGIFGVPLGTYAVQVFHDENDNLRIDRNFLGLPTEGMGFSNNAPFRFGPPSFREATIAVGPDGARVSLRLRYLL